MTRSWTWLLLGSFLLLNAPSARADSVKQALFVMGIHMGGAEGVAVEFIGDPPRIRPGGIALIKRTLTDSIAIAETLKVSTTGLKTLLADVDRVGFAEMADRLAELRLAITAEVGKNINPGAGAFFIMGIHQSGAERVALGASGFARDAKPGTAKLIERQLTWMADGTATIKVSLEPVTKIQTDLDKGATFADLADQLAKLRLKWQDELTAQPGFDGVAGVGGGGKVIFSQAGNLTNADPMDRKYPNKRAKVHAVPLRAGQPVIIEIQSGDGRQGATFFDTWLRVEDAAGKNLAENDDNGMNLNSRLEFNPPSDGTYNLVVTTYRVEATGSYTLSVRQK